jgi:hypothetical protein
MSALDRSGRRKLVGGERGWDQLILSCEGLGQTGRPDPLNPFPEPLPHSAV